MRPRAILPILVVVALTSAVSAASAQETIRLRIASGHPAVNTYVNLMQTFFVPEVTKRVAERTKHKVEFVEGYGGSMVKVADTLEGVQSGIIDIGGYCFCFEPSNLPLHAYQVMLPFGTMSPDKSLKSRARGVRQGSVHVQGVRGQVQAEADRADRRQRLQPRHDLRVEQCLRPQGPEARRRRPQPEMARIRRRDAGADRRCPRPIPRCRPASTMAGSCSRPAWVNFKLYEVAKYYTEIGFGAITWHGLTINTARWGRLPKDVQDIILEVAKEYEAKTGTVNEENYPKQLDELTQARRRPSASCPDQVRADWAKSLSQPGRRRRPRSSTRRGLPATQVLELALAEAEKLGHKWPVRYAVK